MENRETVNQVLDRVFVLLQRLEIQPTERNISLLSAIHKDLRDVFNTINTEVKTDEGDKTAD